MKYLSILLAALSFSCLSPDIFGTWTTEKSTLEYTFLPAESADLSALSITDPNPMAWDANFTLDGAVAGTLTGPIKMTLTNYGGDLVLDQYTGDNNAVVILTLLPPPAGPSFIEYKQGDGVSVRFAGVLNLSESDEILEILETEFVADDERVILVEGSISNTEAFFADGESTDTEGMTFTAPVYSRESVLLPASWEFGSDGSFTGLMELPGQDFTLKGDYTYVEGKLTVTAAPEDIPDPLTWTYQVTSDGDVLVLRSLQEITSADQGPQFSDITNLYAIDPQGIQKIISEQLVYLKQ